MKLISLFFISFCLIPSVYAGIHNITIGSDVLYCGDDDGICPSDYAGCDGCIDDSGNAVDDTDCCSSACGWSCTDAGVVCGDSTNEIWKEETDSEGDSVGDSGVEDCTGTCTSGTEEVIDDTNSPACLDTYYNSTSSCADDGILYMPYTDTSNVCQDDISCKDTDGTGDMEICDAGNWHDPDESLDYCIAASGSWTTGTGTDTFYDDYNGNLVDGYCDGDDGYIITGAVVGETYRGSSYCEALSDVTITIKDATTLTTLDTDTTTYSASWEYETLTCHVDSADNDVGEYSVTLESGTYYLVAEKAGYNTVTRTITVDASDQTLASFWMYKNAECQSDCTMNDRICYAECDGVNECSYSTYEGTSTADYCDGLREGYRYVLSENEDDDSIYGYEVYCCNNEPQLYEREYFTSDDVETSCVENVIEQSKAVTVSGEILNIHFVLFSDPKPEKTGCSEYEDYACNVYGDAFC